MSTWPRNLISQAGGKVTTEMSQIMQSDPSPSSANTTSPNKDQGDSDTTVPAVTVSPSNTKASNNTHNAHAPTIPGPPLRGGIPFVVYDSRDFQDRSESTWAYCSRCNQVGMSVIKLEFSWRAYCSFAGDEFKIHERVHFCPFCKSELGRRINVKGCCS